MTNSYYKISLNIHDHSSQVALKAKKGDTGRKLLITLTDGRNPYPITDECRAVFAAKKADGKILYNECYIIDHVIAYEFTPQTTAAVGKTECEIKLYGADDKLLTSARFVLIVVDTVYNEDDELASEKEFTALTALVSDATELIDDVEFKLENGDFKGDPGNPGVYVLAEGETLDDAPADAEVVIDPNGEADEAALEYDGIISEVSGNTINIKDSSDMPLLGLKLYGSTVQNSTPTPDAPVALVSPGDGGSIHITVCGNDKEHTVSVSTHGALNSIDDARDEIDFASGVRIQRTHKKIFDGTESFNNLSSAGTKNNAFIYHINEGDSLYPRFEEGSPNVAVSQCSHFVSVGLTSSSETIGHQIRRSGGAGSARIGFRPQNVENHTIDTFKAWVKAQYDAGTPLTVVYPLATHMEELLSEAELSAFAALHTHKPNTSIFNDGNAEMEVSYAADTKTYIDNLVESTRYPEGTAWG